MFTAEQAEQAYNQIDSLEVDDVAVANSVATGQVAGTLSVQNKVCTVYNQAKPLLLLLTTMFFIPVKWQNTIRTFTQTMDLLCGAGNVATKDINTLNK